MPGRPARRATSATLFTTVVPETGRDSPNADGSPMMTRCAVVGLALMLSASGTRAQDGTEPAKEESAAPQLRFTLSPRGEYAFESDLDDQDAEAAVGRAGLGSGLSYQATDRLTLILRLEVEASWYRFSGMREGGGDAEDLLEDAYSVGISPVVSYGIDDKWSVIGGVLIDFSGEADADVGDSGTYGGFGMVRYAFSDRLALSVGLGGKSRLEDDARVIPLLGVEWKITDRVTLSSEGPGLRLTASINDQWSAWVSGAWESREYRLEDDHAVFADGVARDERVPVRAGATWSPSRRVSVDAFVGVVLYQKYEFLDRDGNEALEDNTDPAPMIGLSAQFSF